MFRDLYIEKFNDVTIVFADICNFTPLTVTLKPQELVETLNDLFGKFDDAAKVNKVQILNGFFMNRTYLCS